MPKTHDEARMIEVRRAYKLSQVLSAMDPAKKRGNFEVYADGTGPNLEVSPGKKGNRRKNPTAQLIRAWFRKAACWAKVHPLLPTAMGDMVGRKHTVDLERLSGDLGTYAWTVKDAVDGTQP
jgi:hypothetical protein